MITFTTQTMQEIIPVIKDQLLTEDKVSLKVLNPDQTEAYAGTKVVIDDHAYIYRSLKTWMDLAEILHCKMSLPKESNYPMVTFELIKLSTDSFHSSPKENEKYGTDSHFSKIYKMEESAFFYYYDQALDNVKIQNRRSILSLGINRGDEFEIIKNKIDTKKYENMNFVGIDHSKSAIAYARSIFKEQNMQFYAADINDIDRLELGRFDLLISIGTLQSPSINFKPFFMSLVQKYLQKDAAIILGFPNCRWIGTQMIYGAKARNYNMSEQSLLYNDVMFCKKYLQQKKYRVTLTGKHYLFLTATKII